MNYPVLAMAYHRLGNSAKAQEHLEKAVNWVENHKNHTSSLVLQETQELEDFRAEAQEVVGKQ